MRIIIFDTKTNDKIDSDIMRFKYILWHVSCEIRNKDLLLKLIGKLVMLSFIFIVNLFRNKFNYGF